MSQAPVSSSPAEGSSSGPSTPNASPAPFAGTPTLKCPTGMISEPKQESAQAKGANGPGYLVSPPTFSYNVLPNVRAASGNSQQSSSSSAVMSNLSVSSMVVQPPVPGPSSSSRPFFSYISHSGAGLTGGQQFHTSMQFSLGDGAAKQHFAPGPLKVGNNAVPSAAAFPQPPVPGQSTRPNSFIPGTILPVLPLPVPSPVSIPKQASSNAASFSFNGNSQQMPKVLPMLSNTSTAVAKDAGVTSAAPSTPLYAPVPVHVSSGFTTSASSTLNMGPATSCVPAAPSFPVPPGMPRTPGTPGPPGVAQSAQQSSHWTASSGSMNSPAVMRPIMPAAPVPSNPLVQSQLYPTYHSLPAVAASPPFWLQSPLTSNLARPPFVPYPVVVPGSFPPRGMPLPSVSLPDSEPPGVTPVGNAVEPNTSYAASAHQLARISAMQQEVLPPGMDSNKNVNDIGMKDGGTINERLDVWTAHKTDAGAVYYYNALTQKSTYAKPSGFKGEPDKVTVQPIPVSWEKLEGTDWTLVTTNDGKKYYYNSKSKLSSWQVPTEVTELGKKQDGGAFSEHSVPVPPTTTSSSEKGSAPITMIAPAVSTGGRDATALRSSVVAGSPSALDLIKKKLQDSGIPDSPLPVLASSGPAGLELNGSRALEATDKGLPSENSKDKLKDANGDGNMSDSSSDSEDEDSGPTKELCIIQFKPSPFDLLVKIAGDGCETAVKAVEIGTPFSLSSEHCLFSVQYGSTLILANMRRKDMLKERGVAPFSKWDKELPKIVFDPRFKAIPSHSARRSLFDHYVKNRAEEERKEKRAAQKAAIEGFKQLLEEASKDIDQNTDYHTFRKKWGSDPRFEAVERKDREFLLNERILPLKRAAEEKAQARRAAAAFSFKSMLQEKGGITTSTRWAKVKDSLREDHRYKSVKHEDRELLFKEYISELKAEVEEADQEAKAKRQEQEKLKDRERELRKRKEREEEEMDRVRFKVRRKEAISSYQALLVESIKDPQASWAESKPKLEKDPQGRATNPELNSSDIEKLFREHVKMLRERCANEFRALLAEVITAEAAAQETEDGKTVINSWSTAKRLLKPDLRYTKMPKKESESLWRRYTEEMQRKQKLALDQKDEKNTDGKSKSSSDSARHPSGSRKIHERR